MSTTRAARNELITFSRQMARLLRADVPMAEALTLCSAGVSKSFAQYLLGANQTVTSSEKLSDRLELQRDYFTAGYVAMVRAGEQAGKLPAILQCFADYEGNLEDGLRAVRRQVARRLTYVATQLLVLFVVAAVMTVYVLPQFDALFAGFHAELPPLTRAALRLTGVVEAYWPYLFVALIVVLLALLLAVRHAWETRFLAPGLLRYLPILNLVFSRLAVTHFAQMLSIFLRAGLPVSAALDAIATTSGAGPICHKVQRISAALGKGMPVYLALDAGKLFSSQIIQEVRVAERANTLGELFDELAHWQEDETEQLIAVRAEQFSVMITLVTALLIGFFVSAMYLPIFKLGSVN